MVVGPISIVASTEPCLNGYGKYDMPACDFCAHSGKNKGVCCNNIYGNSLGRYDDTYNGVDIFDDKVNVPDCLDIGSTCEVGAGACYPGLVCAGSTCTLPTDNPEAHAASSLVTSSSSTSTILTGDHSFVLVVVGLLGAAMTTLYNSRHRGLFLRRHQYNEVDATRIEV